jgi:hypothetical protein
MRFVKNLSSIMLAQVKNVLVSHQIWSQEYIMNVIQRSCTNYIIYMGTKCGETK